MLILDNIPTEPGKSIYIDNFICRYITNFKFDQEDPYLLNQINEKKKEISSTCKVEMKKIDISLAAKIGASFGGSTAKKNQFIATSEYGYSFYIEQFYDVITGEKIQQENYKNYKLQDLLKLTLEYSIGNRIELHISSDEASLDTTFSSLSASVSAKKSEVKCLGLSYGLNGNVENNRGIAIPTELISLANFNESIKVTIDNWRKMYQNEFPKYIENIDNLKPKLIGFSVKIPNLDDEISKEMRDIYLKNEYLINYSYVLRRIEYGDTLEKAKNYIDNHGKSSNAIMTKYKDVINEDKIEDIYRYFFQRDTNKIISKTEMQNYQNRAITDTMKKTAKELLDGFMHMKK